MATWFSAAAVLPALRAELGISSAQGSLLTIAVQIGFVAGSVASASTNLADLFPVRRIIFAGAVGAAAANGSLLLAGSFAPALLARFFVGVFLAGVYGPSLKLMATWFRRQRGTALGIVVGALTLGSALPHLVNGLGGADWRPLILITSALSATGGLLALFAVGDGPLAFPKTTFDPRKAGTIFADRRVRLASLGYFGHMWELYAMWAWFAAFFTEVLGGNARGAGLATFAVIGVGAIGCLAGGVIGDRAGKARSARLSMIVSALTASFIGALVAAPWPLVLGVGLVWGFWVVADSAQFSAMVTEHADQRYVGTAVTMQLAVGFTLTTVTIFLVPVLREVGGWWLAFAALAPGPAIGIAAMSRLERLLASD